MQGGIRVYGHLLGLGLSLALSSDSLGDIVGDSLGDIIGDTLGDILAKYGESLRE